MSLNRTTAASVERYLAFGPLVDGETPQAAIFRTRGQRAQGASGGRELRRLSAFLKRVKRKEEKSGFDVALTDAFHVADDLEGFTPEALPPPVEEESVSLAGDAAPIIEGAPPEPPPLEGLNFALPPGADPSWVQTRLLQEIERQTKAERSSSKGAWFTELFNQEYLKGYPHRKPFARKAEIDFIESNLDLMAGGRILDLACGTGRHAIPLGERGYEVVGIDLSLPMLQTGLSRLDAQMDRVRFVHGDMRDLRFTEVFDGAVLLGTSLGFFSEPENLGVLLGIYRALKRGGRFVLQVINRDYLTQSVPDRAWWAGDGCLVQEDIDFDHTQSRLKVHRYSVLHDGREQDLQISLRVYSAHELQQMLTLVGFKVESLSGGIDTRGAFFGASSPHIWLVASR